MGDRHIFHEDEALVAEFEEVFSGEGRAEVSDDCVWQTESMYDLVDEFSCFLCCCFDQGLAFNPLGLSMAT